MQVVNLFGDDWDSRRDRPGWLWNRADVGKRAGAEVFGISLYEVEPGQKIFPYHWQHVEEEMLVVLEGEPTLRTSEGEQRLTRGDTPSSGAAPREPTGFATTPPTRSGS